MAANKIVIKGAKEHNLKEMQSATEDVAQLGEQLPRV